MLGLSWLLGGLLVAAMVAWPLFGDFAMRWLVLPVMFGPLLLLAIIEPLRRR